MFRQKRLEVTMKRHVHADEDKGADGQAKPHALVMSVSDTDGESAPWDKNRLQIQHAEYLHSVFGNGEFLPNHANLSKAEALHQRVYNLVVGYGWKCCISGFGSLARWAPTDQRCSENVNLSRSSL